MERKKPNKTFWLKILGILNFDPWAGSKRRNFFETMSTMLVSGIDIRTILTELKKEEHNKYTLDLINNTLVEVENGTPLWRVIEKYDLVPYHYIALIRIGEQSGNLPRNLEIVVTQMGHDREFVDKIRSASLYPSIIAGLLIVVSFGLMTFVIPKIATVYTSLKVELPLITRIMLGAGDLMGANIPVTVTVFIVLMLLFIYIFFVNRRTKKAFTLLMFHVPGVGRILLETEIARMGYVLSSLLRSGISLPDSFRLMINATQLSPYVKFYEHAAYYVDKGYTLELIFNSYEHIEKILPLYPRQLIINGEKSRSLEQNLDRVADIYAKKNELSLKDINTIFEPIMMIVVWIGVSVFAISVIMPIYSIMGNINDISQGGYVNQAPITTVGPTISPTPTPN